MKGSSHPAHPIRAGRRGWGTSGLARGPCAVGLFAVWVLLSAGCATKSAPVLVAYGRLVSQRDEINLRVARYEVSAVQRGHLPTNMVEVVFWRKTQVGQLPREAILLLSRPSAVSPPTWHAVGGDASRGILPDTPAARARTAALPDACILDAPRKERLSRSRAEEIARDYLWARGIGPAHFKLKLRRAEFGWEGTASIVDERGDPVVGGESDFGIRDSGDILYWTTGRR